MQYLSHGEPVCKSIFAKTSLNMGEYVLCVAKSTASRFEHIALCCIGIYGFIIV